MEIADSVESSPNQASVYDFHDHVSNMDDQSLEKTQEELQDVIQNDCDSDKTEGKGGKSKPVKQMSIRSYLASYAGGR